MQRPTPPHLTSVMAEQMLARACENESENAKRMKLGLEPVSQSLPSQLVSSHSLESVASQYKAEQLVSLLAQSGGAVAASNGVRHHHSSPSASASPFPGLTATTNGRDMSEAGPGLGKKTPLLTHKLNGTEITAVRQLITGKHSHRPLSDSNNCQQQTPFIC